ASIGEIAGALKGSSDGIGGFQANGELMAGAGVISGRKKRRIRRDVRNRGKTEIAFAVRRVVRERLDDACRGFHGRPIHALMVGHNHGAVERLRVFQDVGKKIGLRAPLLAGKVSGADRNHQMFLLRDAVEVLEELQSLGARNPLGVFGKWLRDDAQSLYRVALLFERGFGFLEEIGGFRNLNLIAPALDIDECRNGADFRLGSLRWILRSANRNKHQEREQSGEGKQEATELDLHRFQTNAEIPVIFSPMISL